MENIGKVFKELNPKYKRFLLVLVLLWGFWTFGLGFLGGWFLNKGVLDKFPEITEEDRILGLAPHIDDEVIGAGGVIQRALAAGSSVRVVYLTNGDDNFLSVVEEEKTSRIKPEEFVALGEERMEEGKKAMAVLGLKKEDLIFLGFPDRGLSPMLGKNYSNQEPFVSQGTKFNHSPYRGTYKPGELYSGENLISDLEEIISNFNPTIIIAPHPRDNHPDHRATFQYLERILRGNEKHIRVYTYLVHFKFYPPENKLQTDKFLFPPKKLFSKEGWFSFELSEEEEDKKLEAANQYKTQKSPTKLYDSLLGFVKRNEIFEEF